MIDHSLSLLLAYDDGPADALPGSVLSDRGAGVAAQALPDHLWGENDDVDDLTRQRWCVVVPEGARGEHLRALVEPLVARRRDEQRAAVATYPVPSRMSQSEAQQWLARVRAGFASAREAPRYYLLLGDLDEVPLTVQQAIALADGCPGRLAFDRDDDLAAYVHKALREESSDPTSVHLYAAATDRTIEHAQTNLLAPVRDQLRRSHDLGELPTAAVADVPDLAAAAAHARAFVFSLTHGYGGDRRSGFLDPAARRSQQGALVLPGGARITAADVAGKPFIQDGFWFMFACYGAGTPADSAYAPWLRELRGGALAHLADATERALPPAGERPFVAAIPRAALANPEGPRACFGHVDVAWQYSYSDADPTVLSRPSKFAALVEDACRGRRAGAIARGLVRAATDAALRLAAEAELARRDPDAAARRADRVAHLWLLHHDLASYVLLGDPAVRLRSPDMLKQTGLETQVASASPALPARLAELARKLGPDKLEEAFAHARVTEPARKVSGRLGIELADLRALEDAYRAAGRKALGLG
jgi:hypothetical protein